MIPKWFIDEIAPAMQSRTIDCIETWAHGIGIKIDGSPYSTDQTPYMKEPLRAYLDPSVREIIMPCPVQSGKSRYLEITTLYSVLGLRHDTIVYGMTKDDVTEFAETRMEWYYENVKELKAHLHPNPDKKKKSLIIHKNGKWLAYLSAENRRHLQSRSAQSVHGDELAQWREGAKDEADKRTTRFDKTCAKRIYVSTPENMFLSNVSDEGQEVPTDFYKAFSQTDMNEWGVDCPDCSQWSMLNSQSFVWSRDDGSDWRNDEGKWLYNQVEKSVRWKCPHCSSEHHDNAKTRRWMNERGRYEPQNTTAATTHKGYHYSGFAVPWIAWGKLAVQFIRASELASRGATQDLREVVRKNFGEFWRQKVFSRSNLVISGGYEMGTRWTEADFSFCTVDVQKDYFNLLIRDWKKGGDSRLRYVEKVRGTWDDVQARVTEHGIAPNAVYVDSGWKRYGGEREHEVYKECEQRGWWALKGMDLENWAHYVDRKVAGGKTERVKISRPFSAPDYRDYGIGLAKANAKRNQRRKFFVMFARHVLKDHLSNLQSGTTESGVYWGLPSDIPEWYVAEMAGEVRNPDTGKWEVMGENHSRDCETMMLVPAYAVGIFGTGD